MSTATKLRQMIQGPGIVYAPGVYDGMSARLAKQVGFDCIYMTGAGSTASFLGTADLGIATQTDMVRNASMIASIDRRTPLIADADTGYGGPVNVARTIELYAQNNVAGLHIEDQVQQKRCGHLNSKELVDLDTYISRIKAAAIARSRIQSDIVLIARTDAVQKYGLDEALKRMKAAKAAGADVAFVEGVYTKEDCERVTRELSPMPCLLNMLAGGVTPPFTVKEAEKMGFKVVIFPCATMFAAMNAMKAALINFKKEGSDEGTAGGLTMRTFFENVGLEEFIELDKEAGGKAYEGV